MSTSPTTAPRDRLHLEAALLALFAAAFILSCGAGYAERLERRFIHGLAPDTFTLKNQSVALQREAFRQPDLLPLYGSSELVKDVPDKAGLFFRKYPTDFAVFPIGKAGTTPLIILQKLASIGPELRGKKVAISISPGWFFAEQINPRYYAGNFSATQAGEFVLGGEGDAALRREAAQRMLAFPETLERRPLLGFALRHLAKDSWTDRAALAAMQPIGWLDRAIARAQDHFEVAVYILRNHFHANPHRRPYEVDWEHMLAKATALAQPFATDDRPETEWASMLVGGDEGFLRTLGRAQEWENLDLLLRGMRDLGAKPLLLSMPINGRYFDRMGVSAQSRAAYYERLRGLAAKYEMPLVDFREHEEDAKFLVDHHDHLSVEGWMYFDAVLDAFFHDRPLVEPRAKLESSELPAEPKDS